MTKIRSSEKISMYNQKREKILINDIVLTHYHYKNKFAKENVTLFTIHH